MKKLVAIIVAMLVLVIGAQETFAAPQRFSENYVLGVSKDCNCIDEEHCQCIPCDCGIQNCDHYGRYYVLNKEGKKVRSPYPDNIDQATQNKKLFLSDELPIDYPEPIKEFRVNGFGVILMMLAFFGVLFLLSLVFKPFKLLFAWLVKAPKKSSGKKKVSTKKKTTKTAPKKTV